MPKSTATAARPGAGSLEPVLVALQGRVRRIESDATDVAAILDRLIAMSRARCTAAPAAPDTAAAERQRARRPPPRGYKAAAVRVDREPLVTSD